MLTIEGRSRLPMPSLASDYNNYSGVGATKQIRAVHARDRSQHRHMWIITGPAGCGKSSIAGYLAKELAIPYLEGDDVSWGPWRQNRLLTEPSLETVSFRF